MIAQNLRAIEAQLHELIANATDEHPIDTHDVFQIAARLNAQCEMVEKGLFE